MFRNPDSSENDRELSRPSLINRVSGEARGGAEVARDAAQARVAEQFVKFCLALEIEP